MQDSNPKGLWNPIFSRLNACWQTDWAIEDQAKNLNSTARPYDQQTFSPPDPTAIWHSHLALAIYIFAVVNFDVLAQASDIRIEKRQLVFLCWLQDSNPEGLWNPIFSRLNACWQTDWAIKDQAKNLNSTARPYDQQAVSPPDLTAIWHSHLALAIYIFAVNFRCSGTGKRYSNRKETTCLPLLNAGFEPRGSLKTNLQQTECQLTNRLSYRDQAKSLNSTDRPYDQQVFSPPDPLPFDIHTWLWWFTYLLLLISMLWHRQTIFESKGDNLSSSAECRIRTQRVSETQSSADWMPADKPTELSRIKLKTWTRQTVPMISKHSAHLTPLPFGFCTWLWRYTYLMLLISMLWHR